MECHECGYLNRDSDTDCIRCETRLRPTADQKATGTSISRPERFSSETWKGVSIGIGIGLAVLIGWPILRFLLGFLSALFGLNK